ncbi:MAG: aldo/keto reductase [bacterium]
MAEEKLNINRRQFLSTSVTCLLASSVAGLAPRVALGQTEEEKRAAADKPIIFRTLGRTGMKLPIISMGAGAAGTPAIVQAAFEAGVRHFDTAANYAYGRNEQMIGNVLSKLGVRDQANIGTKIMVAPQRQGLDPDALKKRVNTLVDGSLLRLKSDYIDILYVHDISNPEDLKQPGLVEAFLAVKESGKAKAIAVSTHANMAAVINATTESGQWDAILTSFNFTMADDSEMMLALENAGKAGIGIVAMKTLAGGSNWPNPESRRNYSTSTINSAALKWVLNNEFVTTAIPGFSNFDHLNEDFAVAGNLDYTDEEKALLGDNQIRLGLGFCRQCRSCLASCPHNVEVPTLMRTHMYAKQYSEFYLARQTFAEIPKSRGLAVCRDCNNCVAQCAHTVDIPARIAELGTIFA